MVKPQDKSLKTAFSERLRRVLDEAVYYPGPSKNSGRQSNLAKDLTAFSRVHRYTQPAVRKWLTGGGFPELESLTELVNFINQLPGRPKPITELWLLFGREDSAGLSDPNEIKLVEAYRHTDARGRSWLLRTGEEVSTYIKTEAHVVTPASLMATESPDVAVKIAATTDHSKGKNVDHEESKEEAERDQQHHRTA